MRKVRIEFWGGPWDGGQIAFEASDALSLPKTIWAKTRVMVPNGGDYHVFQPDLALMKADSSDDHTIRYREASRTKAVYNYLWSPDLATLAE